MDHEIKSYKCRHIFADGHRCGSPSLRKEEFCYYHHSSRIPLNHTRTARGSLSFDLVAPEDRNSIQRNIGEVLQRLAADEIQHKRAALLLYGLSIASANLARSVPALRDDSPIEEIVDDLSFGLIAPPDDRPHAEPDNFPHLHPHQETAARHHTINLARAVIDRTLDLEIRVGMAEALHAETEAEYKAACEAEQAFQQQIHGTRKPQVQPAKPLTALPAFAQTPQYMVVDEPHSPRYSESTSRYPMVTSG